MQIKLGISTCPNDTFAFHAILNKKIDLKQFDFEIELLDVQQLNEALFARRFDVCKVSFVAAFEILERIKILGSGAALGFGNGPLLLSAHDSSLPRDWNGQQEPKVLTPGKHTTAAMLYQIFHNVGRLENVVFSEVMPRLKNSSADFGVCIHEGRFTWQQEKLHLVEDLGNRWEKSTGSPLPLGGIVAFNDLGVPVIREIQSIVKSSIEYGLKHRQETLETMRKYAQEFSDEVLFSHVDLYVNQWTVSLGDLGESALMTLFEKCRLANASRFADAELCIVE